MYIQCIKNIICHHNAYNHHCDGNIYWYVPNIYCVNAAFLLHGKELFSSSWIDYQLPLQLYYIEKCHTYLPGTLHCHP